MIVFSASEYPRRPPSAGPELYVYLRGSPTRCHTPVMAEDQQVYAEVSLILIKVLLYQIMHAIYLITGFSLYV